MYSDFYSSLVAIPSWNGLDGDSEGTRHGKAFAFFRRSSDRYGTQESTEKKRPKGMAFSEHGVYPQIHWNLLGYPIFRHNGIPSDDLT